METTMEKTFTLTANTLMSNQPSTVKVFQDGEKGICFLNNGHSVIANAENVISTQNCTVIGNQEIQVGLIEHFMAALAISNIDSVKIEIDNKEMPILDGSAIEWITFFKNSGFEQAKPRLFSLAQPIYFINERTTIAVIPDTHFSVSYCVDFHNNDLNSRWVYFDGSNLQEVAEARTFGYLKDLERFQSMGIGLGVNEKNTVGLTENGYTTNLRSQWEPIKHKILDLVGDFYLSGINPFQLKARIVAINAGHSTHVEVAKILKNYVIEEEI